MNQSNGTPADDIYNALERAEARVRELEDAVKLVTKWDVCIICGRSAEACRRGDRYDCIARQQWIALTGESDEPNV